MEKKMLFIFNPQAGKTQIRSKLVDVLDIFVKAGCRVEVHVTQSALDAKKVVMERGENYDLIVGSGGDGTLNEVVSGVMELERKPAIGYIPAGTTNDFAASHKIPKQMIRAAELIVEGKPVPVDIGKFDERYFTYVAAFGALTDVSYKTKREAKAMLGYSAYILEGAKNLSSVKPQHITIETEKDRYEGDVLVCMVTNAKQVAGFKSQNTRNARLDDGKFEVLVVEDPSNVLEMPDVAAGLLLKTYRSKYIKVMTASHIHIESDRDMEWVLDGEFGGMRREVTIDNCMHAVQVIKKASARKRANIPTAWNDTK